MARGVASGSAAGVLAPSGPADRPVKVPGWEMRGIWRFLLVTVVPFMRLLVTIRREGTHHIPREGSFVVAPNHTSNIDPIVMGIAVFKGGRTPHFLGKSSLWKVPGVGALLRATRQIPVERGSNRASDPLGAAARAAAAGSGIIVYPEGTLTRDPEIWPMRGKTGAVRIAIGSGIPLIPAAHWGTQAFLPPYARFLRLIPRRTIVVRFGDPVDLSRFAGKPLDSKSLAEATDLVMTAITRLVEDLRGEKAPAKRWDPAEHNQTEFGRPETV